MFPGISKKESGCIQERKVVTQIRQELGHVSCANLCFLRCQGSADIGQVVPILGSISWIIRKKKQSGAGCCLSSEESCRIDVMFDFYRRHS